MRRLPRIFLQPARRLDRPIGAFPVADEWSRERVRAIARTFLRGYNGMAAAENPADVHRELADVDPFLRPFGYEGAAMGFGPWALAHGVGYDEFESVVGELSPATVYQSYVGWGWWLGLWYRRRPGALARVVAGLLPRYRLLVFEGMGFRAGFLSGGDRRALARFARLHEDARHVCHQGFGRSLWFSRMGEPDAAARVIDALDPRWRGDAYSGLGLGCAYSWLDRAEALPLVEARMPAAHRADFRQGAAFGWEARKLADPDLFDRLTTRLPADLGVEMHRAVATVRDAGDELDPFDESAYQAWRAAARARLSTNPTSEGAAHVH